VEGAQPSLAEIVSFLREKHQLATQKLPQHVLLVDALPMTATGKVQKHVLRDLVAANQKGALS
jgi:acyl-CoA synthetase (AMP-forming)/AMP-acid ligase II